MATFKANVKGFEEDLTVEYRIDGYYVPATRESPEEYPEFDIVSVKDEAGKELSGTGELTAEQWEQICEQMVKHAKSEGFDWYRTGPDRREYPEDF